MRAEPVTRAGFDDRTLALLAADGHEQRLSPRERISLDRPVLTVVLDGYLRVFRHAAFVRDVSLYLVSRGDPLGIERLLDERRIETGAEALGPARVLVVPIEAFERHASTDPSLYLRGARALAVRALRVLEQFEGYGRGSVESRVAATLLHLAADNGVPEGVALRLDLPLSQEDLAALIGVTRESCSSALAGFARQGFVQGRRLRGLVILDEPALRAVAAGSAH